MRYWVYSGWIVLDPMGKVTRYEFGHGVQAIVLPTKKEAHEQARLLAEREDELASGDCNRWESGRMSRAEVRRRGYRVVQAHVCISSQAARLR